MALRPDAAAEEAELHEYLGERFDRSLLERHSEEMEAELARLGDEATLYRTSEAYLYDLTAFAMWETKDPYRAAVARAVKPGAGLLDYGCGIGSDGLRLLAAGYRVAFADFANPSTRYLRWRLERRGLRAAVYDLDGDEVPGGFDLAYAFDVIEHVEDPFAFLEALESRARLVLVNLLESGPDELSLHHELPLAELIEHAVTSGLRSYALYHGRSHLVLYEPGRRPNPLAAAAARRAMGRLRL
jgi:2-polyprenyl-3-methyl-5-hydroxy-6-metoxy-1,4-benzoquinol methylase